MSITGLTLVLAAVGTWILLLWSGWTLVFMGAPEAVVRATREVPASITERIYFVGFTIFTLGIGDFKPVGPVWEILTTLASLSGFILVTFSVTYLMPVVQAAVSKRAFASRITALGESPVELLAVSFDGNAAGRLQSLVEDALADLAELRQTHSAYPVLHFFHEPRTTDSIAVAIARLDEAVRLAELAVEPPLCAAGLCRQWRVLVERFISTMGVADDPDVELPPLVELDRLRARGLPVVGDDEYRARMSERARHRRLVHGLLLRHGWTWDAVDGHEPEEAEGERRSEGEVRAAEA